MAAINDPGGSVTATTSDPGRSVIGGGAGLLHDRLIGMKAGIST